MAWQARTFKLRFWLQLFGVTLLLPSVAFSFYLVVRDFQKEAEESERAMRRRAQVIGLAVNERLIQVEQVTRTLADSPFAQQDDIPHLYEFARNVQQSIPIISRFALIDPTGQAVFSTFYPLGHRLDVTPDDDDIRKVLATGKAAVSGFYISASSQIKTVAVDVPVFRDGKVIYVFRASLHADSFDQMLRQQTMRAGWVASVLDQNGVRLARVPSEPALIGLQASPTIIEAARRNDGRIFDATMLQSWAPSRALVVPIAGSGWSVVANVPKSALFEDLWRNLAEFALAITLIFAGTVAYSTVVARHIDREFREALARPMGFVGEKEPKLSHIAEANEIAQTRRKTEEMRTLITALESSESAIFFANKEGCIEWCNPAFVSLTGFSHDEVISRTPGQLIKSGLHDGVFYAEFWQTLSSGNIWRGDFSNRRKDGSLYHVYQTITPVLDPEGGIFGFVAVSVDITARKELEKQLTESEATLRSLFEESMDAVLLTIPNGEILAANPAAVRLFGYSLEELLSVGRAGIAVETDPRLARVLAERQRTGGVRTELTLRRKDGSQFEAELSSRIFLDASGSQRTGTIIRDISERKAYQDKAIENAALTRSLLDSLDISVALVDENGVIEQVNRGWRDFCCDNGGSDQLTQGVGLNYFDACDKDDPDAIRAINGIRQVLSGEVQIFRMEYPCDAPAEKRWFVLTVASLESNRQKLVVTHTNITPLKRALNSITQFKHIVEHAPMPLMLVDRDFRFIVDNPFHAAMLGKVPEDVIGRPSYEVLRPDLYAKVEPYLTQCMRGIPQHYTLDQTYPDGRRYAFEVKLQPFRVDQEVEGVVVTMHDVTELTEAKRLLESQQAHLEHLIEDRTAQLVEARNRTQSVLDSSADGIIGIDDQNNVVLCNPAALSLLGYTFEELKGRNAHDAIHHLHADGSRFPEEQCPISEAIRQGHVVRVEHDVFWHKEGYPVPVTAVTHPIIEDGRVKGAVMNFRDISERVRIEAEQEDARQSAEQLAKMKSEFLSNMSHEVRTPLNGILGLAKIGMRESRNHPEALDQFSAILRSGKFLLAIVNDILDLSKIEAGKLVIEQIPFDPEQLCEEALDAVRPSAEIKHLTLSLVKDTEIPAACLGDPMRISQILLNFLSNAVKFTEQGELRIALEGANDQLKISVTDSGIGIASEDLDRLFQPFEQLDGSTTRKFGGTGLGLAISCRLANLMGGGLSVRSAVGKGSTFELSLPLVKTDRLPRQGKADPEQLGHRLQGLRILVAEDNELNRFVLEDLLHGEGAKVVSVANGRLAVEVMKSDPSGFDVLLMDVQMPEMDGVEAARRILETAPNLPIIGQTAHVFREEHERCIAAGMTAVMTKPIDDEAMIQTILSSAPCSSGSGNTSANKSAPPKTALPVIDWKTLMARFRGRRDTVAGFIDLAVPTNEERILALRQLADLDDIGQIASVAHGIKGVAGTMAALEVEALAVQTLECARTGDRSTRVRAIDLAEALERLVAVLRNGIPDGV